MTEVTVNVEEARAERLAAIRRRHLDVPCGPWSRDDECFLLSQVVDREVKVASLEEKLAERTKQYDKQITRLEIELRQAKTDRDRLQAMSEEAFSVGRDNGLAEAADKLCHLANDIQPKD